MILAVSTYNYEAKDKTRKIGGEIIYIEPQAFQNRQGMSGYSVFKGNFKGDVPKAVTAVPGTYEATFETRVSSVQRFGRTEDVTELVLGTVDKLVAPVTLGG